MKVEKVKKSIVSYGNLKRIRENLCIAIILLNYYDIIVKSVVRLTKVS